MLNHLLQTQKHRVDKGKAGDAIHPDFMKPFQTGKSIYL